MGHDRIAAARRAANVSLPTDLVEQARELESVYRDEVRRIREKQWTEENWEAIQSCNAWVEEHGLPLAKYRMF